MTTFFGPSRDICPQSILTWAKTTLLVSLSPLILLGPYNTPQPVLIVPTGQREMEA